ncbi:hypothetical protein [Singulisphaera sp. PoT]|uniref:hypothetical protein n=1 Tax=Singulisphaera sp. PoT TaxID=3411797 RepID=UPI003BF560AB
MFNFILLTGVIGFQASDPDAIIRRHEQSLQQIHSLKLNIRFKVSQDKGKTWSPVYESSIVKSGSSERIHTRTDGHVTDGEWAEDHDSRHVDFGYYSGYSHALYNYDPENPPKIPIKDTRISGNIRPSMAVGPYGRKLLWSRSLLFIPDKKYSLKELYKSAQKKTVTARREEDGMLAWDFDLAMPNGKTSYILTVSQKHNYLITKKNVVAPRLKGAGLRRSTSEVVDFYDNITPGISIPKLIRGSSDVQPDRSVELTISDVEVNKPISEAELSLNFPTGAIVTDETKKVFYVWGKEESGKAYSHKQILGYLNDLRRGHSSTTQSRGNLVSLLVILGLTAALLGVIAARRRMSPA